MRRIILVLLCMVPLASNAGDSGTGPLFMKDMLGDREFFEPWGIGLDYYTMDQDYTIKSLEFVLPLPGIPDIDTSLVGVSNELDHYDLKFDVWLTPFLNVFGLVGRVDANTRVDLSSISLPGLPPLGILPVSYDGTVYGGGINLIYGTDRWFASLNNTWTDTNLSGDFDSSAKTFTTQPRVGLVFGKWTTWVGGMYLDTQEKHSGTIDLHIPGLPPVPFKIELETLEAWNYTVGAGYVFSPKATAYLELGFGDRDHTLANFTYRF